MGGMSEARRRKVLEGNGLSIPPGSVVLNTRYKMGCDDWYAETDLGWYWWDVRSKEWKYLPSGPL